MIFISTGEFIAETVGLEWEGALVLCKRVLPGKNYPLKRIARQEIRLLRLGLVDQFFVTKF